MSCNLNSAAHEREREREIGVCVYGASTERHDFLPEDCIDWALLKPASDR